MKKLFLLFLPLYVAAQCPPYGQSKNYKISVLNTLKNRDLKTDIPNPNITLSSILAIGNDTSRWNAGMFAEIEGYLIEYKDGGAESCNCFSKKMSDHDIHLVIGLTLNATGAQSMICEITPKLHKSLSDIKAFKGKKVKLRGWMFPDKEHWQNARNTCLTCTDVWRGTLWELHPVTSIELSK